jgi:type IV secretion system protein VirD4
MENTSGEGAGTGDKFWKDCERLLYTALIAYLWQEAPPEDQNIPTMIEMLEMCRAKEEDEDYQNAVDILFEDLEREKPDCLAAKQYRKFKAAAGKTLKSILISCAARLAPFDIDELREAMLYDELRLDELGDRRTAFFLIMSDTDSTYSFLSAMVMYQMFNLLCEKADNEYGGSLPFQVRCLLDEFANCGKIPDFQRLISTVRSRNISCMIILQSLTQLSTVYKDHAETVIDCCDTLVFLGGKSVKTTKQVSEMIGKTTVDTQNTSESRGQTGSYSLNRAILGRDLIDPSEIGRLKRRECLVLITGLPPFRSRKYPAARHKRFRETADGGAPLFDIRSAVRRAEGEDFLGSVTAIEEAQPEEPGASP